MILRTSYLDFRQYAVRSTKTMRMLGGMQTRRLGQSVRAVYVAEIERFLVPVLHTGNCIAIWEHGTHFTPAKL